MGFAEADPTNDVDGIDAAYKMVILSQFAFGMNVSLPQVDIRGIRGLSLDDVAMAKQLGYEIKLIGSAEQNENSISVEVAPMLVNQSTLLHLFGMSTMQYLLKVQAWGINVLRSRSWS